MNKLRNAVLLEWSNLLLIHLDGPATHSYDVSRRMH